MNKSFIFGIASTLAVVALAGGGYWLGKSNSNPQSSALVASEASHAEVVEESHNTPADEIKGLGDKSTLEKQAEEKVYPFFTLIKLLYAHSTTNEETAEPAEQTGNTEGLNNDDWMAFRAVQGVKWQDKKPVLMTDEYGYSFYTLRGRVLFKNTQENRDNTNFNAVSYSNEKANLIIENNQIRRITILKPQTTRGNTQKVAQIIKRQFPKGTTVEYKCGALQPDGENDSPDSPFMGAFYEIKVPGFAKLIEIIVEETVSSANQTAEDYTTFNLVHYNIAMCDV